MYLDIKRLSRAGTDRPAGDGRMGGEPVQTRRW
jgi:hypothetical protein